VHLLDAGVSESSGIEHIADSQVELEGHVIDCPQVLATGSTILLNIRVYLSRKGFEKMEKKDRKEASTFWQEQQETEEEEAMRNRKEALGALFSGYVIEGLIDPPDRIGVKPLQSNALLQSQKRNGTAAATIDEASLKHFEDAKSPRKSPSPKSVSSKGKGKASARTSDDEDEDEDSGDEAEKLNDKQMHELDNIYRK